MISFPPEWMPGFRVNSGTTVWTVKGAALAAEITPHGIVNHMYRDAQTHWYMVDRLALMVMRARTLARSAIDRGLWLPAAIGENYMERAPC